MINNTVHWALCPWFEETGNNTVHPDDLDAFRTLRPYGLIFKVIKEDGEWVSLKFGNHVFRVASSIINPIFPESSHMFDIGEKVFLEKDNILGEIYKIAWHHQKARPIYTLKIEGKIKSKRYWSEDLRRVLSD